MRITINRETCSFHGNCVELAPEVFGWNDDFSLQVKDVDLGEPLLEQLVKACKECPTQSLSLEDGY